jgi:hypothetical protein
MQVSDSSCIALLSRDMDAELKTHKRKFNKALEPVKVMLSHKQYLLRKEEWLKMVEQFRVAIINQPEQYLNGDLSRKKALVSTLVNLIFEEFLKETESRWQYITPAKKLPQ